MIYFITDLNLMPGSNGSSTSHGISASVTSDGADHINSLSVSDDGETGLLP